MVCIEIFITIDTIYYLHVNGMSERTSVQLYKTTKEELTKIKGELTTRNGVSRSYDDTILELIRFWRHQHKEDKQ